MGDSKGSKLIPPQRLNVAFQAFGAIFILAWVAAVVSFPIVKGRPSGYLPIAIGLILSVFLCRRSTIEALNRGIGRGTTRSFLLCVAGIGLALRLIAIGLFPITPANDHDFFHRYALRLLQGNGYGGLPWPFLTHIGDGCPKAFYPPGMTFLLAGWYTLTAAVPTSGKVLNALAGTALIPLIYDVGHRSVGKMVGRWAAAITCIMPTLVFYAASLGYEVILGLILFSIVDLALILREKPRLGFYLLIGGLLGCGSLIKPIALLFPILLLIYWLTFISLKRSLVGTCVTMLAMVIVVSPWTLRNYQVLGAFVPVSTNGGYVLYSVNNPLATGLSFGVEPLAGEIDEASMDRVRSATALRWIAGHPWDFSKLALKKATYTWGTTTTIVSYLSCDRLPAWQEHCYMAILNTAWTTLLVLCIRGTVLGCAWRQPGLALPILLLAYVFSLHLVFEAESRHHIPVLPSLILIAACGFAAPEARPSPSPSPASQ